MVTFEVYLNLVIAAPKFELLLKTRLYNLSSEHIIVYSLKSDLEGLKIYRISRRTSFEFFFLNKRFFFFLKLHQYKVPKDLRHTYTLLFDVNLGYICFGFKPFQEIIFRKTVCLVAHGK